MPTLSWKDYRINLDDIAPYDTTVMYVNRGTTISELVADTERWAKANADRGGRDLMIYCHGNPGSLQICKEWIGIKNVKKLEPLAPYFDAVQHSRMPRCKGRRGARLLHQTRPSHGRAGHGCGGATDQQEVRHRIRLDRRWSVRRPVLHSRHRRRSRRAVTESVSCYSSHEPA